MKRLLLLLLASAVPLQGADIDVVRSNFIGYYTAAGADRTSPRMQTALSDLESATRANTAAGFLLSDGSWSDIDYQEVPSGSWSPWEHMRRLTVMVKAYKTPGQFYYRDPLLLAQIESAMSYVMRFYGPTVWPSGNWWFWTIGVPLDLGPQLVLMRGDITQKTFDDLVSTLAFHIGSSPTGKGLVGPVPVGENLVWSSFTHLCLGLAKDDAVMLGKVRDAMAGVTLPSAAEGIKSDSSFHQHGPQLYTGGYGGSFANDVAKYALIARGTGFAMPSASLNSFAGYMADGIAWSLYGNYFDVSVVGREVARRSTSGFNGVAALVQSAFFPSPRQGDIQTAATKMLQSWQWALPTELAGLAASVEAAGYAPLWPSGHRHYFASDYTVHRRPDYFASVKMFSIRTKSGENTNGENILGSRQSDGRFFLSLDGTEHFGRDIWPALDWSRLPGITVEQLPTAADASYGFGTRLIVGGTGDGRNGVSAMDVAPLNSTLTAKKSWFFFDDAVVFLTNSIKALSGATVETVVNQWPLSDPAAPLVRGSDWALCDRIGYYFPSAGNLQMKRETRTGTWAALGGSTDTTPHTSTFQTIWFDHGVNPANASAEYAIVPNATADSMRNWAAARPITIVANNSSVSAVRDERTRALGIVFWTAAAVDGISSDSSATVYITTDGKNLQLSAADPTNGIGTFRITIPGQYVGTGASLYGKTTIITVPENGGKTFSTLLKPARPVKRRAVRG